MSAVGGFVAGSIGLAVLDAVLSTEAATARVGGAVQIVATAVDRFVSPSVPAIGVHGKNTHPYEQAAGQAPAATSSPAPATFTTRPKAPPAPVSA